MLHYSIKHSVKRVSVAAALGLVAAVTPLSVAGAELPAVCDYMTDRQIEVLEPTDERWKAGAIDVHVLERIEFTDVDEVTVLQRWVGEGIDLGPAPVGDPVFDSLPTGYAVVGDPTIERVETAVVEGEDFTDAKTLWGCPQGLDWDVNVTGDQFDPFSWVALHSYKLPMEQTVVFAIPRTHFITETRTYQVVRVDEGGGEDPTPTPETSTTTTTTTTTVAPTTTSPSPTTTLPSATNSDTKVLANAAVSGSAEAQARAPRGISFTG